MTAFEPEQTDCANGVHRVSDWGMLPTNTATQNDAAWQRLMDHLVFCHGAKREPASITLTEVDPELVRLIFGDEAR